VVQNGYANPALLIYDLVWRKIENMVSTVPLVTKKIWKFPEPSQPSCEMVAAAGGHEILARLMMRRGINKREQAEAFLDSSKYTASSPMEFADMSKAIVRITQAIASKEKVIVYGDYDVDGVTATSVVLTVLQKLGANVDFYIPSRASEGYGLNLKAVSILASKKRAKLIITCDCGISNFAEINLAKSLGVETIIVDHHSMPEVLPPAVATLHPKQLPEDHPLFHLPGVGVAYKLAEALLEDNNLAAEVPKLLDFVALGMIADMVPLVQENRYLVQIGLPALVNSPRAGIKALLDNTVKMDGTDIVGFGLAPRINAVGRLADASLAVNLMTVEDESKAQELANQLEMENARRQELCDQIFFEADLKAKHALSDGQDNALALYSTTWHHGVVGIVASRLVEKYHCPVFIAEMDQEEGKIKGSARGISGIDLYQILKANDHLLTKWGGHQMAAGFSAEAVNADVLCRALVDSCNRALSGQRRRPVLEIDLSIEPNLLDLSLAKLLRKMGPFGMWNKKPVLTMQSLTVLSSRPLGKEGKHHRLMLRSADGANQFECVYWRSADNLPADGEEIDLAFNPEVNVFNHTERLQLVLCDWRRNGEPEPEEEEELLDFTPAASTVTTAPLVAADHADSSKGLVQALANHVVHLETRYDGTTASTSVAEISFVPDIISGSAGFQPASKNPSSNRPINHKSALPSQPQVDFHPTRDVSNPTSQVSNTSTPACSSSSPLCFRPPTSAESGALTSTRASCQITFKDLRSHASPASVVDTASRKLGDELSIFAESCKLNGHEPCDRSSIQATSNLLIWQFPPSIQVFRSIISKSQPSRIYLCGGAAREDYDASSFLKRLLAMVRFAVNQRDGQAHAEKLCAGLSTTKMALALGLTLLKKLELIDWYAEDSVIFLDISGSSAEGFDELPEYRQLANTLREITEFRNWCAEAPLNEIQSVLLPNAIRLSEEKAETSQEGVRKDTTLRANYNDRASHVQPGQPGKS